MSRFTPFCLYLLLCLGQAAAQPFVVEPYLQMGMLRGFPPAIRWSSSGIPPIPISAGICR